MAPPHASTDYVLPATTDLSTPHLADLLRKNKTSAVPKHCLAPEADRPTVKYNEWADLPVIDFSELHSDEVGLAKKLAAAASEWGFFQIINHGVSLESQLTMEKEGNKFFALPEETKNKIQAEVSESRHGIFYTKHNKHGYRGNFNDHKRTSLRWAESLLFNFQPSFSLDELIPEIWPEGNPELRNSTLEFCGAAEKLCDQILNLFAVGLGVRKNYFSENFTSGKRGMALRFNHYPPCPQPDDVLGTRGHTDPFCITILQQDQVGGLQVEKDAVWLGVKPIQGAFVVNIGDVMQAWTNGRFKSCVHRAVVNSNHERLTLGCFNNVDIDAPIIAPAELVDEAHPRLFKPFTLREFSTAMYNPLPPDLARGQLVIQRFRAESN